MSAPYQIVFAPVAARQFRKLASKVRGWIAPHIDALATNPRPHGVEKLKGEEKLYRIRVGDYRVIYEIQDKEVVITVVKIGHRREVYR